MTHRSVRRCIAPRPVGCCTDSRPESRGPIHRAQARDGPSLAENHNNACQFHEPPRAASADRRPGQDPAGRPCDRSVHRPLLAALPGTAPSRSRPADGADGAGARAHARTPRAPATGAGDRRWRDAQPLPAAFRQRPCGTAHRCPRGDPQLRQRRRPAPDLRTRRPLARRRLERALRRHQRHRHLRGRAAGPDHPAGRALP